MLSLFKRIEYKSWFPWAVLIFLSFIWGTSFILIKKSLLVFDPVEIGNIRIILAGTFLLPVCLKHLKGHSRTNWIIILYIGLTGTYLPAFIFPIAQQHIASSLAGVFNASTPLFTVLTGMLLFSQKMERQQMTGLALGFVGVALLIFAGADWNFGSFNVWGLLIIGATVIYSINGNLIGFKLQDVNPLALTSISITFLVPMALVYLFGFTDFVDTMQTDPNAWRAFSYVTWLALFSTTMAMLVFNYLIYRTDPVFGSTVTYLIPVVAICWGIWDGEKLYAAQYMAILLILLGVYFANRKKKYTTVPKS